MPVRDPLLFFFYKPGASLLSDAELSDFRLLCKRLTASLWVFDLDGRDIEPFIGRTFAPHGTRHGKKEKIIRRSREQYATKREVVERRLHQWLKLPPV